MKRCFRLGAVILLVGYLAIIKPAYAYLDPGLGSQMLQAMIAGIFAVGLFLKIYWNKLGASAGRMFKRKSKDDKPR